MQWVSHRNHRGDICAVDFIWLLNPDKYRKLLKATWNDAVFGMFKVTAIPLDSIIQFTNLTILQILDYFSVSIEWISFSSSTDKKFVYFSIYCGELP